MFRGLPGASGGGRGFAPEVDVGVQTTCFPHIHNAPHAQVSYAPRVGHPVRGIATCKWQLRIMGLHVCV